ncbi:hypothetical protein [Novosphingobium sp. BL-52-GroH]|uniref:hypothetical protein n=1 Tax=Novosphingobium sp. BL-52-GroH TaxID=3349877 RepID=UPI00384C4293
MMALPPSIPMSEERIIEQKLIGCGLVGAGFSVKYEEELQSIEVIIQPAANATADHFGCIRDAVGHEIVRFEDHDMYAAYDNYASEAARPKMLKQLEGEIRKKKLLQGLPERKDFPSLAEYARALETHAGMVPGTALRAEGDGIVFDPPRKDNLPKDFLAEYSDLLSIAMFASMRDRFSFGVIGNAAVATER